MPKPVRESLQSFNTLSRIFLRILVCTVIISTFILRKDPEVLSFFDTPFGITFTMNTPSSSLVSILRYEMRELESPLDEPTICLSVVSFANRTKNHDNRTPIVSGPSLNSDVDIDATSFTSPKVVHNSIQGISGSPNKNGGTKSLLSSFVDRNLLIKQRLSVESFEENIPSTSTTSNNPDSGTKRPRVVSENSRS